MADQLKDLLNRVAAGEMTPEEAQAKLLSTSESPAADTSGDEPVRRINIRGSAVRLIVVGDPTVDTAIAEGPHRLSRQGDQLSVHSDLSAGEYQTEVPRSAFATWLSTMNRAGSPLRIRVNPNLPLDVLAIAGSLELSGMRAPVRVGVEAGSAKLHDGQGPLAISVASGSADVDWQFHGTCSVNTDLGSSRVFVTPGSDIAITADATLGTATIRLADGSTLKASDEGNRPVVVGAGTGTLSVTSRMGSAVVSVA